ncbi:MAG: DNA polymerase III subunit gamma/tau [Candidatus Dormibacteria bacterium]
MTALYTRYRSQRFDALVGQDAAVRTLKNAITGNRLAHAYLFTGIRGTGKTSIARLLAKAVNCLEPVDGEPDNTCVNCLAINDAAATDLLEIDAASNRGVDEIRDLREKARYLPAMLRRKVYIIDEAHQLTNEAFNALLKTLEEPPDHVLFVLCTTESHKLPATIISRCQRFDFRRIAEAEIADHLAFISQQEGIAVRPDGLALLAAMAQGSMRDAITMLDQMASAGVEAIDAPTVRRQLGLVTQVEIATMLAAAAKGDSAAAWRDLDRMCEQGADMRQLASGLAATARRAMLLSIGAGEPAVLGIEDGALAALEDMVAAGGREFAARAFEQAVAAGAEMRQTHDPRLLLEWLLLKLASTPAASVTASVTGEAAPTVPPPAEAEPSPAPDAAPSSPTLASPTASGPPAAPAAAPVAAPTPAPVAGELAAVLARWDALLDTLRGWPGASLRGLLKDAAPVALDEDLLTLGFRYAIHSERVQEPLHRAELEKALGQVFGGPFRLAFHVNPDVRPPEDTGRPGGGATASPRRDIPPPAPAADTPPAEGGQPRAAEAGGALSGESLVHAAVEILGAQVTDIRSRPRA